MDLAVDQGLSGHGFCFGRYKNLSKTSVPTRLLLSLEIVFKLKSFGLP